MRYRQDLRVAYQVYDGAAFLVQPQGRTMHRLDAVGTHVWEALVEPLTLEDLVQRVTDEFEVEPERAREDVREFLGRLEAQGLIVRES
jgi:hypothetical protein